jgi:hypothetical protein
LKGRKQDTVLYGSAEEPWVRKKSRVAQEEKEPTKEEIL